MQQFFHLEQQVSGLLETDIPCEDIHVFLAFGEIPFEDLREEDCAGEAVREVQQVSDRVSQAVDSAQTALCESQCAEHAAFGHAQTRFGMAAIFPCLREPFQDQAAGFFGKTAAVFAGAYRDIGFESLG